MSTAAGASDRGPIVFVHIPKTAGTSLRTAAVDYFGKDAVAFDYGPGNPRTSRVIARHLYEKPDLAALADALRTKRFVAGHVCATKYLPLLPDSPLVTFLRDPVARVESEFVHCRTHYGYTQTLPAFIGSPLFRNKQRLYTRPLEPFHFDFIGRAESFEADVARLNRRFGIALAPLRENERTVPAVEPIDPALLVRTVALNGADVAFCYLAGALGRQPIAEPRSARPLAFGSYERGPDGTIRGFAFALGSTEPVEVGLYAGGVKVDSLEATLPRPALLTLHMRLVPEAGFEITPRRRAEIEAKGPLEIRVEGTGVVLAERTHGELAL